jgi:hypothetical protein
VAEALKAAEPISIGPISGLAQYVAIAAPGFGWMLRLEAGDVAIEGWGVTQDEAHFMFEETCKQWLKDTNTRPQIA